jgi:valyl-tRNA synthetase
MSDSAPKSKNQEKNEAKRLAKLQKFQAKQDKLKEVQSVAKPAKEKKEVKKEVVETVIDKVPENKTVKGEKKSLAHDFEPSFQPLVVEQAWYDWWEKQGFFQPRYQANGSISAKGVYMVPIPPPNVTGTLHLGHALTNSIQDVMTRWNRMKGKTVLYLPGADHAGIATQVVVEKKLMRDRGITRHDIGREAFIKETFKWKDDYIGRIYNQIRRLGASVDWTRATFTMDPVRLVLHRECVKL